MAIWTSQAGGGGGGATTATAVSVTPTGGISSTNVQAALAELDLEKLAYARGTLAGRPAGYGSKTLYVVNGDSTASNNGKAYVYDTGLGSWIELAGSGGSLSTGTFAARPATPASDAIYVVSGDTALNNGRIYFYNSTTPAWFEIVSPILLTGTLAARPASTGINAIYVVSGDATASNNGLSYLYNTATSAWIPFGDSPTLTTGTLAARPASPTRDTLYVVSGDSASNNGRSFFYNLATTTWIELAEPNMSTGTLAARPTTPTINTIYVVSGDAAASNNGRSFFYDIVGAVWIELTGSDEMLSGTLANRPVSSTKKTLYVVTGDSTATNNGKAYVYDTVLAAWIDIKTDNDTSTYTLEATGFPSLASGEVDRASSVISFNNATRTFSIAPSATSYVYLLKNIVITKTTASTVVIPNTTGNHYIYFDSAGALQTTTTFDTSIIADSVYLASVYWNSTSSTAIHFGDERHGCTMDTNTHIYLHTTIGAKYVSGMGLNTFSVDGNGSTDAMAQFSIQAGAFRDEDILHSLSTNLSTSPIPVLYRLGTDWYSATGSYNFKTGVNGRIQYNLNTAGSYSLAEAANTEYVLIHIVATNDSSKPYVALMGLGTYANRNLARQAANTELFSFSGLLFQEFVFIGTVIYQTNTTFTNTAKARIVTTDTGANYMDWRTYFAVNPVIGNPSNVIGSLNDLVDVDLSLGPATNNYALMYNTVATQWYAQQVVKSVNGATPDALGNVLTSITKVTSGTLAARPAAGSGSLINAEAYIVAGDPTPANNGRTYIYQLSTTTWHEVSSLGGIGVADLRVVSYLGSNTLGSGTFNSPYQTIQYAISTINFGTACVIIVLPGTYTENVTVSTHLNLTIAGLKGAEGSNHCIINGSVTTSGTATRLRLMDLTITGTSANPIPYQDTGSTGRNIFESVEFIPFTTSNAVQFSGTSKNFFGFYDCTFGGTGTVNMGSGTPSAGAQAWFTRPNTLYSLVIPNLWSAGIAVTYAEALGVTHTASPLLIQDTRQIIALTSTATTANGALWIDQSSMYIKSTNTYTVVNKTGNCNYRFRNFEMARAGNTINGTEVNTTDRTDWTRLKELYDVDLITTAPVADNVLKYDAVNAKWIPGVGGGGGYTYSATAPLFTGLNAGHIWVKSTTMEQYLYVIDDSLNNVWVALGTTTLPAVINSNRNKLYNGNFFVNQRVQAATLNAAGNILPADRWIAYGNLASKFTVGRNLNSLTPPTGFSSYVGFQTPVTAYNAITTDIFQMAQGIEGVDLSDFNFGTANARTVTLSFWYRASIAGIYNFSLRNNPTTHAYVGEFTIITANSWQYITVIIPGCTLGTWSTASGSAGAYLTFDLGSGSQYVTATPNSWIASNQATKTAAAVKMISNASATVYIAGVQLEIGTTATPYEDIGFFAELNRCKRFFQKSYSYNTALQTSTGDGRVWGQAVNTYWWYTVMLEVEMCFAPGLTIMGTAGNFNVFYDVNGSANRAITFGDKNTKSFVVSSSNNTTSTSPYYFHWWANADI